jgi:hypothetical protein
MFSEEIKASVRAMGLPASAHLLLEETQPVRGLLLDLTILPPSCERRKVNRVLVADTSYGARSGLEPGQDSSSIVFCIVDGVASKLEP